MQEIQDSTPLLWLLALVLVGLGFAGTVLPALPGPPLVFLGLLVAAWADGFEKVGWLPLTVLGLLAMGSLVVDLVAASLGAKRVGASYWAIGGAALGTLVGLFFGLPGLILGPFLGAAAGEYFHRRDLAQAGKVGLGTWFGIVLGVAAKIGLIFLMIGLFITAYLI